MDMPDLSSVLHLNSPPMLKVWAALTNAGFKVCMDGRLVVL